MTFKVLYLVANVVMIVETFMMLKLLYDQFSPSENRELFIAIVGLDIDLISCLVCAQAEYMETAMMAHRFSIAGRAIFELGFIYYINHLFKAKYTKFVFGAGFSIKILMFIFTFFTDYRNPYIRNVSLFSKKGISIFNFDKGILFYLNILSVFLIGLWAAYYTARLFIRERRKKNMTLQIIAVFYMAVILIQGISYIFYILNMDSSPDFTPLFKAVATAFFAALSLQYGLIDYGGYAQKAVDSEIGAGLIVLTDEYRVLYANEVARNLFHEIEWENVPFVYADELKNAIARKEYTFSRAGETYRLTADRNYVSGKLTGYSILIVNITDIATMQHDLRENEDARKNMLTNISHELRTPLNAIIGATESMLSEIDNPENSIKFARIISEGASALNDTLDDIMSASDNEKDDTKVKKEPFSICSLLDNIIEACSKRAERKRISFKAYISPDIPINVIGDSTLLGKAIMNVLANAIRYTENGGVTLSVNGRSLADGRFEYVFAIADTANIVKANKENLRGMVSSEDVLGRNFTKNAGLSLMTAKRIANLLDGDLNVQPIGRGSTYAIVVPAFVVNDERLRAMNAERKLSVYLWDPKDKDRLDILEGCEHQGIECKEIPNLQKLVKSPEKNGKKPVFVYDYSKANRRFEDSIRLENYLRVAILDADEIPEKTSSDVVFVHRPFTLLTVKKILDILSDRANPAMPRNFTAPSAKILIVDDDTLNLQVASGMLERFGVHADTVDSGYACIEAIHSGKEYDLIFMDYMMEGMDGIETTKAIRRMMGRIREVPILAYTANVVSGAREQYLEAGMNDVIEKPAGVATFARALQMYLPEDSIIYGAQEKEISEIRVQDFPTIPGVNREEAIRYCAGNAKMYIEMLSDFANEIVLKSDKINKQFREDNLKDFTVTVHGVKGTARMLGFTDLFDKMYAMELAGNREDKEYIDKNLGNVLSAYRGYIPLLKPYVDASKNQKGELIPKNRKEEILVIMKERLEEFEMGEAEQALKELLRANFKGEEENLVKRLSMAINDLDYYESLECVEALLKLSSEN